MSSRTITPRELMNLCQQGQVNLIDVRTPTEYEQVHAEPARLMPLQQLDAQSLRNQFADDGPLYVICHTGGRAGKACAQLEAAGLRNVINVEGGTQAWEQAGLPVVRGRRMMSLERQVRIAAGSLVLLGVLLGALVNPWIYLLPGFVGAGLVFAGITDTCGMGMLLARMPWNQRGTTCASCTA